MIKTVSQNLIIRWILWHFKYSPGNLIAIWGDFLRFSLEFFSIVPLLKTWISPWKRLSESYSGGLVNITENIQVLILNTFSRILGFLIRTIVIVFGLLFTALVFISGIVAFVLWLLLPLIFIAGIIFSLAILI